MCGLEAVTNSDQNQLSEGGVFERSRKTQRGVLRRDRHIFRLHGTGHWVIQRIPDLSRRPRRHLHL